MKKSQLRMAETIAILFIFFLLLILGLFFYIKLQRATGAKTLERESDITSIEIVQRASTLPELQCSSGNDVEDNCIDIYKAAFLNKSISGNPNTQQYYAELFGLSKIELKILYPDDKDSFLEDTFFTDTTTGIWTEDSFTIYENPSTEAEQSKLSQSRTNVPISLYNPLGKGICSGLRGSCAFGMMEITVFARK